MIIASLASLSSREALLEQTIHSLAPQVDGICVYLNGYEKIPKFLNHPKVLHAILSSEAGWRGAEAKFWFWDQDEFKAAPQWQPDDIALICDDDIVYPPDYVKRMVGCLDRHPGSVVCVHGAILKEPFTDYAMDRFVARSSGGLANDARVHLPGTGTTAFRVGTLPISLKRDFPWSHCVDPCIGMVCNKLGIEVWSVARPNEWLKCLMIPSGGTNIYRTRVGARNTSVETKLLAEAGPWPEIPHTTSGIVNRIDVTPVQRIPAENPSAMLPSEVMLWLADHWPQKEGVIVELGSGHGTQHLVKLLRPGQRLVSVEHNKRWVGLFPGTQYIYAPIRGNWYDGVALKKSLPPKEHIIALIVDGPPGTIGRDGLYPNLRRFPDNVPMLLDDVQRPVELALAKQIAEHRSQPAKIHQCSEGRAFATLGWE